MSFKSAVSLVVLIVVCAVLAAGLTACGKKAPPQPLDEAVNITIFR